MAPKSPENALAGLVEPHSDNPDRILANIDNPQTGLAQQFERSENPLGSGTNSLYCDLTTITNSPYIAGRSAAVLRFALQAKARELLPDHRVGWCMRRFRGETARVGIVHAKARGSAYFDGLMRCGRVWVCPVCASKIAETRRVELTDLLLAARIVVHHGDNTPASYYPGWFLTMITYTIQHEPNESAQNVLARLDRAWKRFTSDRWIHQFRERFYISGSLRALEMTHGDNGWHPHYHVLQFHHSVLSEIDGLNPDKYGTVTGKPSQPEMIGAVALRWRDAVARAGGFASITNGVDLTVGDVSKYPIKSDAEREMQRWGMPSEVTKQTVKRGKRGEHRSMTDLLIDAAKGDDLAAAFWREGVAALEGHKQLEPSKGLWKMLGRGLKTEAEASEDTPEVTDQVLALLSWQQWRRVLTADARGAVLEIATTGDTVALWTYLNTLGIYNDDPLAGVAA